MSTRLFLVLLTRVPATSFADVTASPDASLYSRLRGRSKIASLVDAAIDHADVSASDRSRNELLDLLARR